MPLSDELASFLASFRERAPAEAQALIAAQIEDLAATDPAARAPRPGDRAPDLTLPDALGRTVSLRDVLRRGPAVVVFYRGGWCPYCNLTLRAWQRLLPDLAARDVTLVAVSPQDPDHSLDTAGKNALAFPVLSDRGNAAARGWGIAFDLPPGLREIYARFGHALPDVNGTEEWSLPIPATFVIGEDGRVLLSHVESDYRLRLEPSVALAALDAALVPAS